ncbi:MAG: PEP-CTERM sorting domain-containing protein [Verrucomicrobiae bacterium]
MKQIQSKLRALALAAGSLAITMAGANAANTYYAAGDLVLYFQQEGSTNTIYADLGNAATAFRGAATGPDAANKIDFVNLNTQLTSAFGASWATATNLYMGVAAYVGTSSLSNTLTNGDPSRTLYVGASRAGAGTIGSANSTGYNVNTDSAMTTGATGIQNMLSPFADSTGVNGYNAAAVVSPTSVSNIDNQNPFLSAGIQGTAFGVFGGGVQQVGGTIASGTSFGSVSNVAFAADLYRIEARNNIVGQVGYTPETARVGTYEGTVTLNNAGSVSFQTSAVPEPSTYAFFGISALGIGFIVARRRKVNA